MLSLGGEHIDIKGLFTEDALERFWPFYFGRIDLIRGILITSVMSLVHSLEYAHLAVFIVGIITIIFGFVAVVRGIAPVLWRLGNGLANRKIALFAKGENAPSLKNLLLDSKLIQNKNIVEVNRPEDIGRAEAATVYIVVWHDFADDIDSILNQKPDSCALIVYSPYDQEMIPSAQMKKLDGTRHTAVTNFRGRLLNDVITSMITTTE